MLRDRVKDIMVRMLVDSSCRSRVPSEFHPFASKGMFQGSAMDRFLDCLAEEVAQELGSQPEIDLPTGSCVRITQSPAVSGVQP